jgi:molecular chaperone HtpG
MTKIKFKLESKDLLYHLIHSIYSNKDLFLRELISNANDACEKMYISNITNSVRDERSNYKIKISCNHSDKTITVKDNGIGMTYEEIEEFLGTIAKSGTKDFMQKFNVESETIGQFGIGFYSAFLVSDSVEVITKSPYEPYGVRFFSDGLDGYILEKIFVDEIGTKVTCHISKEKENEKYISTNTIQNIVRKHSNYIKHAILLNDGIKEFKINEQYPYWSNLQQSDEQDQLFIKSHFQEKNPVQVFKFSLEGKIQVKSILYIKNDSKGLSGIEIYNQNHFVTRSSDFFPEFMSFVGGVIDIYGSNLNLSREQLSVESEVNSLKSTFINKIVRQLKILLINDRENFLIFWQKYGEQLLMSKFSDYENFYEKDIPDLFVFRTSYNQEYTTLNEYVERNPLTSIIYYLYSTSVHSVTNIPQYNQALMSQREVLVLTSPIEVFYIEKSSYGNHQFKSIMAENPETKTEKEKTVEKEENRRYSEQLDRIRLVLKDKIINVSITKIETDHIAIIEDSTSLSSKFLDDYNRTSKNSQNQLNFKINSGSVMFENLMNAYQNNKSRFDDLIEIIFNSSKILYGFKIDDPVQFNETLHRILFSDDKTKTLN